jgi:hypothetical protein
MSERCTRRCTRTTPTDRIVLDSNDDPNPAYVARGWAANYAVGAEDRFPDFAAWAAAGDPRYHLGSDPKTVRAQYLALARRLDAAPLRWPGATPPVLDGNTLRVTVLNTLYDDEGFPRLAALMSAGMPAGIFPCAFWRSPAEPAVRVGGPGPSNLLLVQNVRDPATPLSGARRLREALGDRARMVEVESGGHDAYVANGNACGDRTVSTFLVDGRRPTRDMLCR